MEQNRLPKSWCVKNDGSQLFKDTVVEYLNKKYKRCLTGNNTSAYYGVISDIDAADYFSTIRHFDKLLTLQQFIEMTTEEFNPKEGELINVRDKCSTHWYTRYFIKKLENGQIITAEKNIKNEYCFFGWHPEMKPIEIFELTIEEIAKLKGCKPEQIRIKE